MAKGKKKTTLRDELKDPKKRKKYIILGVAVLLVFALLASAGSNERIDTEQAKNKETSQEDMKNAVDEYCTDASLLQKYIDLDKVKIVSLLNYNDQFTDMGESDGKHKYLFTWNGKNKETDNDIHFECSVSGKKDDLTLESLRIDGVMIFDRTSLIESDEQKEEDMLALKKCTVMEASDIFNTNGIGSKTDDWWADAKKTCEEWQRGWTREDFVSSANEDWENRKNETIEGRTLTEWLKSLSW